MGFHSFPAYEKGVWVGLLLLLPKKVWKILKQFVLKYRDKPPLNITTLKDDTTIISALT